VFLNCTGLKTITVGSSSKYFASLDGVLFTKDKTQLLGYPGGSQRSSYTIPKSVKTIVQGAFENCTKLTSVTIPNSVKTIGPGAFSNCSGLTSLSIPNSVTTIDWNAFNMCTALTSVTIPNSVKTIGSNAFANCTGLTSVTIPNSVKEIGRNVFVYCDKVTIYGNAGSSAEKYAKEYKIPFKTGAPLVRIEAEGAKGAITGSSYIFKGDKASGGYLIAGICKIGSSSVITDVPKSRAITIGFTRGESGPGKLSLYLNNIHSQDITFQNTGDGLSFSTYNLPIVIPAGANIKFQLDEGDIATDIDYVDFDTNVSAATSTTKTGAAVVRVEAEGVQSSLTGNSVIVPEGKASGGKLVTNIYAEGDSLSIANCPSAKTITIGYAKGSEGPGLLSFYINGKHSKDIPFSNTAGWFAYSKTSITIDIPQGATIAFKCDKGDLAANIDYVDFN